MTRVLPTSVGIAAPTVTVPIGLSLAALESTIASLWTTLTPVARGPGGCRLAFVSAHHGEGTTTLAGCASIGLARFTKLDVAFVEGNTFGPGLLQKFGLIGAPTIPDVLAGRIGLRAALLATDVPHLRILAASSADTLTIGRLEWQGLIAELAREVAFVVLDAAPYLDRPQGRLLLEPFERAVAVVRAGATHKDDVRKLTHGLRASGLEVVGAVLNRCH